MLSAPSRYMSDSGIQNRLSFEGLGLAHANLLGTAGDYRIYVGMVDSYGITLGLRDWMHNQYSRLVQVKASKRLGSDQLESDNSHEHALKLINIECKHE